MSPRYAYASNLSSVLWIILRTIPNFVISTTDCKKKSLALLDLVKQIEKKDFGAEKWSSYRPPLKAPSKPAARKPQNSKSPTTLKESKANAQVQFKPSTESKPQLQTVPKTESLVEDVEKHLLKLESRESTVQKFAPTQPPFESTELSSSLSWRDQLEIINDDTSVVLPIKPVSFPKGRTKFNDSHYAIGEKRPIHDWRSHLSQLNLESQPTREVTTVVDLNIVKNKSDFQYANANETPIGSRKSHSEPCNEVLVQKQESKSHSSNKNVASKTPLDLLRTSLNEKDSHEGCFANNQSATARGRVQEIPGASRTEETARGNLLYSNNLKQCRQDAPRNISHEKPNGSGDGWQDANAVHSSQTEMLPWQMDEQQIQKKFHQIQPVTQDLGGAESHEERMRTASSRDRKRRLSPDEWRNGKTKDIWKRNQSREGWWGNQIQDNWERNESQHGIKTYPSQQENEFNSINQSQIGWNQVTDPNYDLNHKQNLGQTSNPWVKNYNHKSKLSENQDAWNSWNGERISVCPRSGPLHPQISSVPEESTPRHFPPPNPTFSGCNDDFVRNSHGIRRSAVSGGQSQTYYDGTLTGNGNTGHRNFDHRPLDPSNFPDQAFSSGNYHQDSSNSNKAFDVEEVYSTLEALIPSLDMLSPALNALILVARKRGSDTAEALSLFVDPEHINLMNLCLSDIANRAGDLNTSHADFLRKGVSLGRQLLDYAKRQTNQAGASGEMSLGNLDITSLALSTMDESEQNIAQFIRNAAARDGFNNITNEELFAVFTRVRQRQEVVRKPAVTSFSDSFLSEMLR